MHINKYKKMTFLALKEIDNYSVNKGKFDSPEL